MRLKPKGFTESSTLGAIMNGQRGGRREKGRVYEAYEVKNKRQKLRCLLLRRKKKIIIFLFMM
jgi:hypothetical protein